MIRRVQFTLKHANQSKITVLDGIFEESMRVVNLYIDKLWAGKNFSAKFVDFKVDTWLSARLQQCLGKQALEVVKSQRKRKKKTKPVFRRPTLNLDSRFVTVSFDINSFDTWITLSSLGKKIKLKLPSRKHKHYHTLCSNGYLLKKSCRLRCVDGKYYVDLYMEKPAPPLVKGGTAVGFDCGYKRLLVDSKGALHDVGLEPVYKKIARKRQGSKAFKRSLTERDNLINRTVNSIDLVGVKTVVVEDLKNVKKNSKGKRYKSFNNKLQRWSYPKVLDKLASVCEAAGIAFIKVAPAYTSQTCSQCGHVAKESRNGTSFCCVACGYCIDADYNAAVNIRSLGVYSPHATLTVPQ